MKNIAIMFLLLCSIANAQTFDFTCTPPDTEWSPSEFTRRPVGLVREPGAQFTLTQTRLLNGVTKYRLVKYYFNHYGRTERTEYNCGTPYDRNNDGDLGDIVHIHSYQVNYSYSYDLGATYRSGGNFRYVRNQLETVDSFNPTTLQSYIQWSIEPPDRIVLTQSDFDNRNIIIEGEASFTRDLTLPLYRHSGLPTIHTGQQGPLAYFVDGQHINSGGRWLNVFDNVNNGDTIIFSTGVTGSEYATSNECGSRYAIRTASASIRKTITIIIIPD